MNSPVHQSSSQQVDQSAN